MADKSKSMMRNGFFRPSKNKEPRPTTSLLDWSMLSTSGKELVNKGIKVPPGKIFHFCEPTEDSSIYIFEAGFGPGHSESVKENIYLYITCNEKKLVVGTLSSEHPRTSLNLLMTRNSQLSHTAKRKTIFFNGWQFSPVPLSDALVHCDTKKEFWVKEVKPLEGITIDPISEGKKYHILKVLLGQNVDESIDINVQVRNKFQKIGTLSSEELLLSFNLEYDEEFILSHTSKTANVLISGEITSLKELPGPPSDDFNLKPAKESDDPEYQAFLKIRQKKKTRE